MDQQKRLLLAIALSFGLTMVFTNFLWNAPEGGDGAVAEAGDGGFPDVDGGALAVADVPGGALTPDDAVAPGEAPAPEAPVKLALPLRELPVERATSSYRFTTEGGGLASAELKGPREREEQQLSLAQGYQKLFGKTFDPPPQVNLARPIPGVAPQVGLRILGANPLSATQRYAVAEEGQGRVVFTTTEGPWEVTKTYTWADEVASEHDPRGYLMQLEVTVKNVGAMAAEGQLALELVRAVDPGSEQAPSMFGSIGNQSTVLCSHGDDINRKKPDNDKPREEEAGALHFVAIDQQYFLSALWPMAGQVEGRCVLEAPEATRTASLQTPLTLAPGASSTARYGVFLGPKAFELLRNVGRPGAPGVPDDSVAPRLDRSIDLGMLAVISKVLIFLLRAFHSLVGNWGLAIVLLTVLVKVLLLPLTHKALVSAEQMKRLQPRMEEIRKKHPDDREKQNAEMMKLYQEAKVNPLGGCLPMVLQFPIWAALFTTLRTSYELYAEPFFGVWSDLTSKDPTYLMPIALGVTMIMTQRLQPQMSMDKSQAFMMTWLMPVFFTVIMLNYPAGLALYIFTNNLLSIAQQHLLRRYLARTGQLTPVEARK